MFNFIRAHENLMPNLNYMINSTLWINKNCFADDISFISVFTTGYRIARKYPRYLSSLFYANHPQFCRDYTRNLSDLLQIFVIEKMHYYY
jgi:hypothetical protein